MTENRHSVRLRRSFRPAFSVEAALEGRLLLAAGLTTLASFDVTDGDNPNGGLVQDADGNLYGTTYGGGANGASEGGDGTAFEIAAGTATITTLASFNGMDGQNPLTGLVLDAAGNLYGTTEFGGAGYTGPDTGFGTVFEIAKGSGTITTLANFDGGSPTGGLVQDAAGNLYGTAVDDGTYDDGTVFEIAKGSGTITTLANFDYTDGAGPKGGIVLDAAGNLYGTTEYGGGGGYGTVFEIVKGTATITALASFNSADGPDGGLVLDTAGNLYGTTGFGGAYGDGTVFEVAHESGTITTLASFNGADGVGPWGGLVQDAEGNLYGTTDGGLGCTGSVETGDGTLFEIAHGSGTITTLASFDGADGASPNGSLLLDTAGNLYGTTAAGGAGYSDTFPGLGTVFETRQPVRCGRPRLPITLRGSRTQRVPVRPHWLFLDVYRDCRSCGQRQRVYRR